MEKEPYIDRLKVFLESSLKKETPEEYKARKESQAQRKVKKETPEEYSARIEYIKKKKEVELKLETQRLFEKAEKQHQNHLNYLSRQNEKAEREEAREKCRESNEKYKAKIDKEKADYAERERIWNSPGECRQRERERIEFEEDQKRRKACAQRQIAGYRELTRRAPSCSNARGPRVICGAGDYVHRSSNVEGN